jgi:hypothetical protein
MVVMGMDMVAVMVADTDMDTNTDMVVMVDMA